MDKRSRILIVDDDADIAALLARLIEAEGMEAVIRNDSASAIASLDDSFDLAILDIMMPGLDGFETCKQIRASSNVPIVFLSAKDDPSDRVLGLTLGGDDYIAKPFNPHELVARVKAHLRRTQWDASPKTRLAIRGLTLDEDTHRCLVGEDEVKLTPKEFELLRYLMMRPGAPCSTPQLFEAIWKSPYDASGGNSVMVHIRRLRKKLASASPSEEYITTVWGVGYKVNP